MKTGRLLSPGGEFLEHPVERYDLGICQRKVGVRFIKLPASISEFDMHLGDVPIRNGELGVCLDQLHVRLSDAIDRSVDAVEGHSADEEC